MGFFSRKRIAAIGVAIILLAATFYGGYKIGSVKDAASTATNGVQNSLLQNADFSLFWDAVKALKDNYYGIHKISDQDIVYGAIKGAVQSTGDPYTVFFTPSNAKKFNEDLSGSFGGIGAEIGIRNNQLTVIAPIKGNPAEKAGLKTGDQILKIDDTIVTSDLSVDEAVNLIRGPIDTKVKLMVMRNGWKAAKEFDITRKTIHIPTLDWKMVNGNIAYIQLYNFSANASSLFYEAALSALLQGARGVVLDLRGDPGGFLEVATDIAGWFLPRGDVVVKEKLRSGDENILRANGNAALTHMPVVVLIDGGSASASEILSGALRDDRSIKLIGEKTFGKGSVQEVQTLKDGSSLKVSIAEWLTPDGHTINKIGLQPDIQVPITDQNTKEGKDPQYDKAIEIIKQEMAK